MADQDEGIRALAEFEAARIASEEVRKRTRERALVRLGPLLTFGPIFMVNLGGDHSFAHMSEPYYWIAMATTVVGAFMMSWGMSSLLRVVRGQRDELEELRSTLDALRLAGPR